MTIYLIAQIAVVIAEVCFGAPIPVVVATAVVIGVLGTLIAHEAIHRGERLGTLAFGVVSYSHFKISHLQGHHARVGFRDDWSTARLWETSYAFVVRAIAMGWWGAWKIEARRLRRRGESPVSLDNFMVRWTIAEIAILAAAPHPFIFIGLSLGAACLTELINYLGHYGLTRREGEAISDWHSWESDDELSNLLLLNAGRHCDHHAHPWRSHRHLELKLVERRVSRSVFYLIVISLFPPLFFRTMHQHLKTLT